VLAETLLLEKNILYAIEEAFKKETGGDVLFSNIPTGSISATINGRTFPS
jgi:hypothetical protein